MFSDDNKLFLLKFVGWLLHYFGYVFWLFLKVFSRQTANENEKLVAPKSPRTIVITGASQGLGEALVEHFYRDVSSSRTIIMISRNKEKLEKIQNRLNFDQEKKIVFYLLDVTNRNETKNIFEEIHRVYGQIDILIVNAGVSFRQTLLNKGFARALEETFDVNVNGVINTILPTIRMKNVRQIGLVSSQAAYATLVSPVYGASKQAIVSLGHDLRKILSKDQICVNIISPGPIKTAMLVGSYRKSVDRGVSTEEAARIIVDGLRKNQFEIVFPATTGIFQFMISYLPRSVGETIAEYFLRN